MRLKSVSSLTDWILFSGNWLFVGWDEYGCQRGAMGQEGVTINRKSDTGKAPSTPYFLFIIFTNFSFNKTETEISTVWKWQVLCEKPKT